MTEETRVALVDAPPKLLDAITVALSPWGLLVLPIGGTTPPPDMASATALARALAGSRDVSAVVWVALPPTRQASLWLYDAQTGQMTVRSLSVSATLDDASAAAVALTLKTLLRSTAIAPEAERPASEGSIRTSDTTAISNPTPPATATSTLPSTPISTSTPPPNSTPTLAPTSTPRHSLRLDAFAAGHFPTGSDSPIVLRAGLAFAWWPARWLDRLGFAVDFRFGASESLSPRSFVGTFSDTATGASARARLGGEPLSVEVLTGPSLHVTSLSGTATATQRSATVQRLDPAVDVAVIPQLSLGARARIGVFLGSTVLLRTQRYSLDADLLLRVPVVTFDVGGRASLALD